MFEDQMTNVARKRRQDLAMQDLLTKSKKIMSNAYNWDKLPQLDLEAFGQFYGTKVGKSGDLSLILPDLPANPGQNNSFGFKLSYTMPIENNLAKGIAIQNLSNYEQQRITELNLIRNMKINIRIALNALGNYTAVLNNALISFEQYKKAYENEQIKFKQGLTTLLNLIQIQDKLTYAHSNYISAQLQFALALGNLRYETGTLNDLDIIGPSYKINIDAIKQERFYTSPQNEINE